MTTAVVYFFCAPLEDHPKAIFVLLAMPQLDFMLIIEPIIVNRIIVSISLHIALSYNKVCCTDKKSLYVAAVCGMESVWGQGLQTGDLHRFLVVFLVTPLTAALFTAAKNPTEMTRSHLLQVA